eukprot:94980_1
MACIECILLPISFAISFISMFFITYYLVVYKHKLFDYKAPMICEMGAKKSLVFGIGLTVSSLILISLLIIQYLKRVDCNDKWNDTVFMTYNLVTFITGLLFCISLIGLAMFNLEKYQTIHMVFSFSLLVFSIIHMVFTIISTSLAASNKLNCINDVDNIIIIRWILFSIIVILNCSVAVSGIYGVVLIEQQKKLKATKIVDIEQNENN